MNMTSGETGRYWTPRGMPMQTDEHGYSLFATGKWQEYLNAHVRQTHALLKTARVIVLLGEPGAGKTFELNNLRAHTEANASTRVLHLDLGKRSDAGLLDRALRRLLEPCMDEGVPCVLFLDSLDELQDNIKNAETVLEDVLSEVSPDALRLVITCRSTAWPDSFEKFLREHCNDFNEASVGVFEIAPYSRRQVSARLQDEAINVESFFAALDRSDAHGLALHPLGLRFLMSQFQEGLAFASSRWELYERGCAALLKENNDHRVDGGCLSARNVQLRLQIAGLLAVYALLTNKMNIVLDRTGDIGSKRLPHLEVARLMMLPLASERAEWNVSIEQYEETLQSALFTVNDDGTFVFAHKTYAEFLAAHFIRSCNAPVKRMLSVLGLADGKGCVIPQLRGLAAWLCHTNPEVLKAVLHVEPGMVFDSSVSLTDDKQISTVFDELADHVERHKFQIYNRQALRSYSKLRHTALHAKLQRLLEDRTRPSSLRQFAATVAQACGLVNDIPVLLDRALDRYEDYDVRQSAASAVRAGGSEASRRALLPLVNSEPSQDPSDELRGIALLAALEVAVPVRDVCRHLNKQPRARVRGTYALALREFENAPLQAPDIEPLLSWLESQLKIENVDTARTALVARMLNKAASAVTSFEEGWASFGRVAWFLIETHHQLLAYQERPRVEEVANFDEASRKRLRLFESILCEARGEPSAVARRLLHGTDLLSNADGPFLIKAYEEAPTTGLKRQILGHLVLCYLHSDYVVREWLLNIAGPNADEGDPLLAGIAAEYIDTVPLHSSYAESLRKEFALRSQRSSPTATIRPKRSLDLLLAALARAETGNLEEWVRILSYLRYDGEFGRFYSRAPEVTKSALWSSLDPETRLRLARAALAYIRAVNPDAILTSNRFDLFDDAGVAALVLLQSDGQKNSDEFGQLLLKWCRNLARWSLAEQPPAIIGELLRQSMMLAEEPVLSLLFETCVESLSDEEKPRLPTFAFYFMPEPLIRRLEAMLYEVTNESTFLALSKFLVERQRQPAIAQLIHRVQSSPDLAAASVAKAMSLLAEHAPVQFVRHIWPQLQSHPEAVCGLAIEMKIVAASGRDVPLLKADAAVTEELFEMLEARFPTSTDEKGDVLATARQYIQEFRTACILNLRNRADAAGISSLRRISVRHPDLPWIAPMVHQAEHKAAHDSWLPYDVCEVAVALGISGGRVIRTERELHDAVLQELYAIEARVSSTTTFPAVYHLWDETVKRPKHEPRLCDWLASELRDRLSPKGAVVNREVQVRSLSPKGMGERTDILVELAPQGMDGKPGNIQRVVIEVKGCWNAELITSPASQLRDNYMKAYGAGFGIYVVMWFLCGEWDDKDYRKRKTQTLVPDETFEGCANAVSTACVRASVGAAAITSFVIDCTY